MAIQSTAGAVLSISAGTPATFDVAGYAALSYTAIGEITNLGEFGREYAEIIHSPIGTRSKRKLKGSYDEGALDLQLAGDTDDAGQILLKTASNSDSDYAYRLVMQNGDKYYFQAKAMSFKRRPGGVDDIFGTMVRVSISSSSTGVGVVEDLAV